ncbi:MAG TPA: serine/threonine-protein kinase, partial [Planctomicrobium sp.]|nr:serine/threonine-protein kinase [Planctomicrobium sp.]
VLPFAAALDARQLQRFRNEAQAAAALHHPHVVPVYGVGCERGVHFYVMQLIEGQNLAALISSLREEQEDFPPTVIDSVSGLEAAQVPLPVKPQFHVETRPVFGTELTNRQGNRQGTYYRTATEIVAQAADGLDYAHSLGIIHRDVKPANILVDRSGTTWVADFGLAQVQTDHLLTQTGDLLGTLRYMSPEQAAGQLTQVDQRTDVYSLGATLYELLTLRPVFEAKDRRALLRQILEEEPPALRTIQRSIPRELETITRKALEKTPGERYASAGEMRDDLRRFLNDLPIHARPPSLLERLAKWSRRHRGVVMSGVVALLLTVAGLSVATWMTAAAYDRERAKAAEAVLQYERAEQNFRQARAAVDEFTRIGEETLGDHPQLEAVRIRMLEAALAYYQNFVNQHRDHPKLQAELETSLTKVELILNELNTLVGAGRYMLLQDPVVRQDLKLTPEQIAPIEEYDRLWREMFRKTGLSSRTERDQRRVELARRQDAGIKQLLTSEQQTRFQQIVWREAGPRALDDATLAGELDLTPAQRTEIRRLLGDYFSLRPGPPPFRPPPEREAEFLSGNFPPPPPRPHGPGEDLSPVAKEIINKELAGILSPQQQQRWQQLLGKPLAGPLHHKPPHREIFRIRSEERETP